MANDLTLHDLIEALADAVIEAQHKIEQFQYSNIRSYFDGDGRPYFFRILMSSPRAGADKDKDKGDRLAVPFLSLVSASRLVIKDVEITMEVRLGSLISLAGHEPRPKLGETEPEGAAKTTSQPEGELQARAPERTLSLDLGAPRTTDRAPVAKVTLRVENQEPTEGMARLLMELNKMICVIR